MLLFTILKLFDTKPLENWLSNPEFKEFKYGVPQTSFDTFTPLNKLTTHSKLKKYEERYRNSYSVGSN